MIRENGPEPTSLLARLAPSFIRIGHFEAMNPSEQARNFSQIFFGGGWARGLDDSADNDGVLGGQGNLEGLRDLVEFSKGVIGFQGDTKAWVKEVVRRNAEMVAGWQVSARLAPGVGRRGEATRTMGGNAMRDEAADHRCTAGCTACSTRTTSPSWA